MPIVKNKSTETVGANDPSPIQGEEEKEVEGVDFLPVPPTREEFSKFLESGSSAPLPPREGGAEVVSPPGISLEQARRSRAEALRRAAETFLVELDPRHREAYEEYCRYSGQEPWHAVLSRLIHDCERRDFGYIADSHLYLNERVGAEDPKVHCQNCGHHIPKARWGQLYCCGKCAAYHQGSKSPLIVYGVHSEECPIKDESWPNP